MLSGMKRRLLITCLFSGYALLAGGCRSMWPEFWPFPERERTTFNTPAMRADAIAEFGSRSTGIDTPEQREYTDQLARQIQVEPDPLVRRAVVNAISQYRTPMARQVLEAGLKDQHEMVRAACCEKLGERAENETVASLAAALREDQDQNVRLAAARALGQIKTPEAVQALAIALEDRDPAMQYAGVQSMKSATGKDYGNDVQVWRQVAAGQAVPEPTPSIADRIRKATTLQ